jgi:calcineurin-like phosphoesterase family protein
MTRFFTSDLHFGHRRVIEYCNRPYADVEQMHEAMVAQWNSQVAVGDEVYCLGDFSLNPKWSDLYTPLLNGTKHLISGNHDATFPFAHHRVNKKMDKMKERYINAGWSTVSEYMELLLSNGQLVAMSHLPYSNPDTLVYDKRYLELRPENKGLPLLHGHLHKRYNKLENMIDVGFDGDLKLLSEQDVIIMLGDERSFIASPITDFYNKQALKVLE